MRLPAALAITLIVLVLAGCRTPDPVVTPQPEPTSTPLFASDEEALAAAEEAYAAYLAVSDQILAEGGANPERAYQYLTEQMQAKEVEGIQLYIDSGWHSTGMTTFDSLSVQQFASERETAELIVYLCVDVAALRIIDSAGSDVTPPSRPDRVPLEVAFVAEGSASMKIERSDLWSGDDFCS